MSTATDNNMTTCANCGKGEESTGDLKACTACKMVKYCNRDCQIAHRPQHKTECKKRAAKIPYTTRHYSNNLREGEIVKYAFCLCQHFIRV